RLSGGIRRNGWSSNRRFRRTLPLRTIGIHWPPNRRTRAESAMSLPPSPVTPLFRLLVRPAPRSPDDGSLPAEVSGQCGAESAVLAAAALLAVFAGGLDVTAWIPAAW